MIMTIDKWLEQESLLKLNIEAKEKSIGRFLKDFMQEMPAEDNILIVMRT